MNFKIKELKHKLKGFTIIIVDGSIVRRDLDIDFTNYGHSFRFSFIPNHTIWIDQEAHPNEMRFFVTDAIAEYKYIEQGIPYSKALDLVKKEDHFNRIVSAPKDLKLNKHFLYTIDEVSIFIIDGNYVRTYLDPTYVEGGHGYVYDYIPKNEIWIDDDLFSKERWFVVLHELIERYLMKEEKFNYYKAHEIASDEELQQRKAV